MVGAAGSRARSRRYLSGRSAPRRPRCPAPAACRTSRSAGTGWIRSGHRRRHLELLAREGVDQRAGGAAGIQPDHGDLVEAVLHDVERPADNEQAVAELERDAAEVDRGRLTGRRVDAEEGRVDVWMTRRALWSGVSAMPLALNPGCWTHSPVSGSVTMSSESREARPTGRPAGGTAPRPGCR